MSTASEEGAPTPIKAVACCVPIAGAILYLVWKDEKPVAAKEVCKFALIGWGVNMVLTIVAGLMGALSSILASQM